MGHSCIVLAANGAEAMSKWRSLLGIHNWQAMEHKCNMLSRHFFGDGKLSHDTARTVHNFHPQKAHDCSVAPASLIKLLFKMCQIAERYFNPHEASWDAGSSCFVCRTLLKWLIFICLLNAVCPHKVGTEIEHACIHILFP